MSIPVTSSCRLRDLRGGALAIALSGVLAFAAAADAQVRAPAGARTPQTPTVRTTIGVSGGVQTPGRTESQSFSVEKNLEAAPITTTLGLGTAALLDVTVALTHAPSRFGGSVSLSSVSRRFGGDVAAQIPHPFFFNTPRPVNGSVSGLLDTEIALHLDVTYELWRSARADLVGFAGGSFFRVTQDLVTDVIYSDTYPYDTATFQSAQTTRASADARGLNLGGDLTWKISRRVGIGVLVRYAHASATLTPSVGDSVSARVGGLQIGAGVRLLY